MAGQCASDQLREAVSKVLERSGVQPTRLVVHSQAALIKWLGDEAPKDAGSIDTLMGLRVEVDAEVPETFVMVRL